MYHVWRRRFAYWQLFYFDKSTKRKNGLAKFCSFCDSQYRRLIKHVNTHWLNLSTAVNRTLSQYAGIRSYFFHKVMHAWWQLYALNIPHVIDEWNSRFQRLHQCYSDPMTEVYLFSIKLPRNNLFDWICFYNVKIQLYTSHTRNLKIKKVGMEKKWTNKMGCLCISDSFLILIL